MNGSMVQLFASGKPRTHQRLRQTRGGSRIDAAQQVVEQVETSTDGGITWTDITADTGRIIDTSFPDTAVLVYQIPPSAFIGSSPPLNTGFRTTLLLFASGLAAMAVGRRRRGEKREVSRQVCRLA